MSRPNGHAMGRVRHIHFVGIGGAGMSGIAEVIHNLGYEVSGSDQTDSNVIRHLKTLGIKIINGHDASYVNGSDVVVFSSAIPPDNPELLAAHKKRIPVIPRAEMLAELMRFRQGIAVAGTHGKTTTTSLIASLLAEGGLDPTYVIGGLLNSAGSHAKLGDGRYLVAEADESDASFLHLQPVMAVLTNIDADHLENYGGDYQHLKDNFAEFVNRLPFYGLAVICADDPGNQQILEGISKPFITYSIDSDADFVARDIRQEKTQTLFTIARRDDEHWLQVQLNLPGNHNVLNSLAAIAIAVELGVEKNTIVSALADFQGIARRCEVLGEIVINDKTILLMDDYAHHPSEILATLSAIQAGWPDHRIIVVYQPHRYSRTKFLFRDFCEVLSRIDVLFLLDIYPAGETEMPGVSSESLCRDIGRLSANEPVYLKQRNELYSHLPGVVSEGDILLTLGAGSIGSLGSELISHYERVVH